MYNMSEAGCNNKYYCGQTAVVSVGESRGCTLMIRDIITQQPSHTEACQVYINTYKNIVILQEADSVPVQIQLSTSLLQQSVVWN